MNKQYQNIAFSHNTTTMALLLHAKSFFFFCFKTKQVGAADKVFELMYRKRPGMSQQQQSSSSPGGGGEHNLVEQIRTSGLEPNTCRGEVTLKNVEMYYPARPNKRVLNGMSLSVPPGSIIALCGASGGGKSSIISLVQHMYEQSSGKVLLDDVEVHEYSPRWLSQQISIVQQEPILFARSIRRNIMYGLEGTDREPSQDEIETVARLSNCDDFISKVSLFNKNKRERVIIHFKINMSQTRYSCLYL
jgi:ATP-binding cassette subfamily B (MDR/TAP) protein 9